MEAVKRKLFLSIKEQVLISIDHLDAIDDRSLNL